MTPKKDKYYYKNMGDEIGYHTNNIYEILDYILYIQY